MTEVKDLTGKMRRLEEKSLTAKTRAQRIFSPRRTGENELRREIGTRMTRIGRMNADKEIGTRMTRMGRIKKDYFSYGF